MTSVDRFLAALPPGPDPGAAAVARLRAEGARLGADLLRRWSEPQRSYHTLAHLDTVLSIVDANARLAANLAAVRLAAWFHDAVYDPTAAAGANEEASAELAARELTALGLAGPASEVARLVRLTADHEVALDDPDGCLLVDADLAVLAAEPADYDGYAAAVRREYRHIPDPLYRIGRANVLRHLLDLAVLYRVVPARAEWTDRARANLHRELTNLTEG